MVVKILFKISLPLVAIAGVLTYGVYLRGGDPGALWNSVAQRGLGQFDKLFAGVQTDTSRAVGALANSATAMTGSVEPGGRTQVFTWKDASGITHYSTSQPEGIVAGTISVDPNVNVLAPVRAPEPESGTGALRTAVPGEQGGELPGVAGQVLATREPAQAARENADLSTSDGLPGVDPAQLLRMLQAAE